MRGADAIAEGAKFHSAGNKDIIPQSQGKAELVIRFAVRQQDPADLPPGIWSGIIPPIPIHCALIGVAGDIV